MCVALNLPPEYRIRTKTLVNVLQSSYMFSHKSMKGGGSMASISFRLTDKSKKEIQSIAKDLDKTVSDIARELLEEFMKNEKENEDE